MYVFHASHIPKFYPLYDKLPGFQGESNEVSLSKSRQHYMKHNFSRNTS